MTSPALRRTAEMTNTDDQGQDKRSHGREIPSRNARFVEFSQRELVEALEDVAGRPAPPRQD